MDAPQCGRGRYVGMLPSGHVRADRRDLTIRLSISSRSKEPRAVFRETCVVVLSAAATTFSGTSRRAGLYRAHNGGVRAAASHRNIRHGICDWLFRRRNILQLS
jgi:hypothetical protein